LAWSPSRIRKKRRDQIHEALLAFTATEKRELGLGLKIPPQRQHSSTPEFFRRTVTI